MNKGYTLIFFMILFFLGDVSFAQDEILFTVGDTEVKKSEFTYIYEKNNFDNKADYSEKSLREYLDLYFNFRLKIKEAEELGLEKDPKLKNEYNTYTKQLYNSFYDKAVTNHLIEEVYERTKQDVSISHIFLKANSRNTTIEKQAAKEKIEVIYRQLKDGGSFEELAKEASEDKVSALKGGYLGYFTTMQIALPELEEAAFQTEVGKFSAPITTKLGYHIVKVNDKRKAVGKHRIAIIRLKKKENGKEDKETEAQIHKIYKEVAGGLDFTEAVKMYSDDLNSKGKDGLLNWFGVASYAEEFESVAFNLKEKNEISEPVETASSWFILKKIDEKPIASYDESYSTIKDYVVKSSAYKESKTNYLDNVLERYGFEYLEPAFSNFKTEFLPILEATKVGTIENEDKGDEILKIGSTKYSANMIQNYIIRNQYKNKDLLAQERFTRTLNDFIEEKTLELDQVKLVETNKEYAALTKEYKHGVLLFDLMEKKVWRKAMEDTVGLTKFYAKNNPDFMTPETAIVEIYTIKEGQIKMLKKLLKKKSKFSTESWNNKMSSKGISNKSIEILEIKKGSKEEHLINWTVNSITTQEESTKQKLYFVNKIEPEKLRPLNEARGFAIAAYQEHLEKEWIEELKNKYKIQLNEEVLKSLIKQ